MPRIITRSMATTAVLTGLILANTSVAAAEPDLDVCYSIDLIKEVLMQDSDTGSENNVIC